MSLNVYIIFKSMSNQLAGIIDLTVRSTMRALDKIVS